MTYNTYILYNKKLYIIYNIIYIIIYNIHLYEYIDEYNI